MVECRYSVRMPTSQTKRNVFFGGGHIKMADNSYILLWMIPHPPAKNLHQKYQVTSLARNDASTIGLQEIRNDLQVFSQEAPKSEKNTKHMTTQSCRVQHRKNASSLIYMNRTLSP